MKVQHFFDTSTFTLTYIVFDAQSRDAVIIDPVLDYSQIGASVSLESFHQVSAFIEEQDLNLQMILETHAHADHLSSSQYLKQKYPLAKLGAGSRITVVQERFKEIFGMDYLNADGSQFDLLLEDGKTYRAGSLEFECIHTPGHTPACVCYKFGKLVFVGDLIFMPDFGTGRCDFPDGSAEQAYHSIMDKLYRLDDECLIHVGHDYMPKGRALAYKTTLGEQKAKNIHIKAETSEHDFIEFRTNRDVELTAPKLLFESVQFNIDGGHFPPKSSNGKRYFKLPLDIEREPH